MRGEGSGASALLAAVVTHRWLILSCGPANEQTKCDAGPNGFGVGRRESVGQPMPALATTIVGSASVFHGAAPCPLA